MATKRQKAVSTRRRRRVEQNPSWRSNASQKRTEAKQKNEAKLALGHEKVTKAKDNAAAIEAAARRDREKSRYNNSQR